jgi:hypothetical protein
MESADEAYRIYRPSSPSAKAAKTSTSKISLVSLYCSCGGGGIGVDDIYWGGNPTGLVSFRCGISLTFIMLPM